MYHYNLLDEKWIRAVCKDGSIEAVSIKDCVFNGNDYKDIQSPSFHGYRFYLYDYLAIRLLATIVADIFASKEEEDLKEEDDVSIGHYIAEEIKKGKMSEEFKILAETYFDRYHDRFDLFDKDHPFLQFSDADFEEEDLSGIKESSDCLLKINPLAPADSGRMFPESIVRYSYGESPFSSEGFHGFAADASKEELVNTIREQFLTTPEEAAYILLYLSVCCPGVGQGNKAGLAGNAYVFETLTGNSLWETILLNVPINGDLMEGDEKNMSFGTPAWRWDSIHKKEKDFYEKGKELRLLDGMFFPCRVIRFICDEQSGMIKAAKYGIISKSFNETIDSIRNTWAKNSKENKREPHALIAQTKDTDKKAPLNPYRKVLPGDELWLLVAATAQTENTHLIEKRGKDKEILSVLSPGASNNIRNMAAADKKDEYLPQLLHVRYYYRMASDKWAYYKTGVTESTVYKSILEDQTRQEFVTKMQNYIASMRYSLRYACKRYFATSNDPDVEPSKERLNEIDTSLYEKTFMDQVEPLFLGENSFLTEISFIDEKDLDKTYVKWKINVKKKALEIFLGLMRPGKAAVFWRCYENLYGVNNKKKGSVNDHDKRRK